MKFKKKKPDFQRITYKSIFGDYGTDVAFDSIHEELAALRNALGRYEDIGYSPEELVKILNIAQKTS